MKTVELLDIDNPIHADFVYVLAKACKDEFFDDHNNDIILILEGIKRQAQAGFMKAFLARDKGTPVGVLWVEIQPHDAGILQIWILPGYSDPRYFLEEFLKFCFETLNLRKLKREFQPEFKEIEGLLRDLGFKKEGYFKNEIVKDGKPVDIVRIGLLKTKYRETA